MKADFETHTINGVPVLAVHGCVMNEDAVRLSHELAGLQQSTQGDIVVDLSDISLMDSNTLGVLICWWKRLSGANRELVFYNPRNPMAETFETMGLNTIVKTVPCLPAN